MSGLTIIAGKPLLQLHGGCICDACYQFACELEDWTPGPVLNDLPEEAVA